MRQRKGGKWERDGERERKWESSVIDLPKQGHTITPSNPSQTASPIRDQVFKYMNYGGHSYSNQNNFQIQESTWTCLMNVEFAKTILFLCSLSVDCLQEACIHKQWGDTHLTCYMHWFRYRRLDSIFNSVPQSCMPLSIIDFSVSNFLIHQTLQNISSKIITKKNPTKFEH